MRVNGIEVPTVGTTMTVGYAHFAFTGRVRVERSGGFTEKEKWALRYADQMYLNPASIDAAFYAELKQHYSEAEVMELGAFIAFHYGMQVFMRTLEPPGAI